MSAFDPVAATPVAAARGLIIQEAKKPIRMHKPMRKGFRSPIRDGNLIKS